eukprot:COSAG04_NODE_31482_length_256_cov_0.993631_2_plen_56_part_01
MPTTGRPTELSGMNPTTCFPLPRLCGVRETIDRNSAFSQCVPHKARQAEARVDLPH